MSGNMYRYHMRVKKRRPKRGRYLLVGLVILAGAYFSFRNLAYNTGADRVAVEGSSRIDELNFNLETPDVLPKWPKETQSAVGAVGYGILSESDPGAKPVPMASLAKVMAAILIIEKYELGVDDEGEQIVFNLQDEAFYNKYLYEGGVVTTVKNGESISMREALNAMLIESSNNLADTVTRYSFGSIDEYLLLANRKAEELGMDNTHFADVTGFSPKSVATAGDLILLAEYAMHNDLFAEIVSTWQTKILKDIELTNTNVFLDFKNNGVVGIKTGLTDEAGGTYMGAARYVTESGDVVIALSVTLGAKNHFAAQEEAIPLLETVGRGFSAL